MFYFFQDAGVLNGRGNSTSLSKCVWHNFVKVNFGFFRFSIHLMLLFNMPPQMILSSKRRVTLGTGVSNFVMHRWNMTVQVALLSKRQVAVFTFVTDDFVMDNLDMTVQLTLLCKSRVTSVTFVTDDFIMDNLDMTVQITL